MTQLQRRSQTASETIPGFFARGVSYYKLFWVFFIASFLGAITETLFMLLTRGELQNRSGLIYGQFSLVWGLGAVLFTVCFHRLTGRRDLVIFLAGTVLGGAYEYLCSWVQEVLFGACFWDYSHIPLNINGRVSLLYSMFWGVAAVLWVKDLYPRMCRWIGRIPGPIGKPLTWALTGFMAVNILLSAAALARWDARQMGRPPQNPVDVFLDVHFPDRRMYQNYSTLTFVGTEEAKEAAKATATAANVNIGNILLMLVYGVIASSTMIIPGISGSFVMLLLGVYGTLIASVANLFPFTAATLDAVLVLLPFGIGVVIGLVYCSKLIKFLLAKFPVPTYAAIFGFVLGSIGCVFPGFDKIDLVGVIAAIAGILVLWGCERLDPGEAK